MPSLNALLGPPGAAPARWPRKLFLSPPAAADEVQARRPARRWDELKPLRVVAGRGPWAGASGPSERRPNGGPQGPEEASDAVSAVRARSEEHTSELQSREKLLCRLVLG